jgi:hypothetical protein
MRTQSWHRLSGSALAMLLICASPAFSAPDANAIADSLVAAAAAAGKVQATYESATASGEVITITGFKAVRTNAKTVVIPAIVVTGAAIREAGGFTAQSIAFDGGKAVRGNDQVTWQTGMIEEALVPSAEEVKAEADLRPFGKLVVGGLTIAESNLSKPITASEVRVVLQSAADGSAGAFAAQIGGVHFPADVLRGRPQEKALLDALGYEQFDVNIAIAGAFDGADDSMTLDTLTVNTADVGTVTVKAQFSGITLGKIVAAEANPDTRSTTKLDRLEVRFDNNGVVERALDMHAALIWGTREDAAAQVNAALPLVLHFIGNEVFQEKVAKAVEKFLVEPKSIAFSAAPSAPVPLEQIIDTTRDEPGTLPDLLKADVSAD